MSRPHPPLAPDPGARVAAVPARRRARAVWLSVLCGIVLLAVAGGYAWHQRTDQAPASTSPADGPPAVGDALLDHDRLDDAPPATVDSPQARQAWLERIRELRDAGAIEAARDSLLEYRRRYPGEEVPDDLEGLLPE